MFNQRILAGLALAICAGLLPAMGGEIEKTERMSNGVVIPETQEVDGNTLQLNGFGTRTRAVFGRTYLIALYLPRATPHVADVFVRPGARRLWIHTLKELDAGQFAAGFKPAFHASNPGMNDASRAVFLEFTGLLPDIIADESDILLDFTNHDCVQLSVDGSVRGEVCHAGFADALLRAWLGREPVQDDLKKRLLSIIPPN